MSGERGKLLIEPVPREDGDLVKITRESSGHVGLHVGMYTIEYPDELINSLGGGDFGKGLLKIGQMDLEVDKRTLAQGGFLFPFTD